MSSLVETVPNLVPDEKAPQLAEKAKIPQICLERAALNLALKKIDFYEGQKISDQNRIEASQAQQTAIQTLLEKVTNATEIDLSILTKEDISLIDLVGAKTEGKKNLKDKDVRDLTNKLNNKFNSEQRKIELIMQNLRDVGYNEEHILDIAKLVLAIADKMYSIIQRNMGVK